MQSIDDIREEYDFLDGDDRYRLLIDLGRQLEPMPDPLKNDRTLVRGCQSQVWVYPIPGTDSTLHFLADSTSAITKGIIALVLTLVQDRDAASVLSVDIESELKPFEIEKHLSSKRTSGIPNMIALIRETAARLAGGPSAG